MLPADIVEQQAEKKALKLAIARLQARMSRSVTRLYLGTLLFIAILFSTLLLLKVFFLSYLAFIVLFTAYLAWFWRWSKQMSRWIEEQDKLKAACGTNDQLEALLKGFHQEILLFRRR